MDKIGLAREIWQSADEVGELMARAERRVTHVAELIGTADLAIAKANERMEQLVELINRYVTEEENS